MIDLSNKRALVCGSSQGIGKAAAEIFARQGASVTLLSRNESALNNVKATLATDHGQSHHVLIGDFANPDALPSLVTNHMNAHGAFDILVNNTGGPPGGPIFDATPEQFRKALDMHVIGNQLLAQAVVPEMKKSGFGRLIQIISTSVKEPIPGLGVSNTTRWAVAAWAKTLSRELAPFGITVNNILPGFTDTARLQSLFASRAEREGRSAEEIANEARAKIPAGRFGTADEIAAAIAFLASPDAAYITGVNLAVDGGRLASM